MSVASRPAATAVVLALVALLFYGLGLARSPSALDSSEVTLARQAYSIAQTGRDLDGRLFPLYIHGEGEVWFPPLPVYAAAAAAAIIPTSSVAVRWPSVVFGVIAVLLVYRLGLRLSSHVSVSLLAATFLLLSPAHYMFSRRGVEGIFAVPFVLGSVLCLLSFLEKKTPWSLSLAGLLLGIGFYSTTTAPLMMAIYLLLAVLTLWVSGLGQPAHYARLVVGLLVPLLCLVPWFAWHPQSYPDTLGRWALHAAHIRNPMDGLRAIVNWGSLTNRASVYWEFLNPAFLFFPADQPSASGTTAAGPLVFPLLVLVPVGIARVVRTSSREVATLLVVGLVVAPLAAATFGENHAIDRALVLLPFAAILGAFGVQSLWSSNRFGRIAAVLLVALALIQARYL